MDLLNLVLVSILAFFILEVFGDMLLDVIFNVLLPIAVIIAVVGGVVYYLYVELCCPAYLACYRFISEHPGISVAIVLAAVLLIILLGILFNRRWLLMTDHNSLINQCNRDIASATEALARARKAEENYRLCNQFKMLEPGRHKYGYNPNEFERKVDQCEETLNRLKDEKQYYEKQRRKADKLRCSLR